MARWFAFLAVFMGSFLYLNTVLSQDVVTRETAPRSARKAYEKGLDALRNRADQKALKYFDKAINKAPGFTDAWARKGKLLYATGSWAAAENCFETLYKLDQDYHDRLLYQLALTEWQQGKSIEAEAHFDTFLAITPKNELDKETLRHVQNLRFASEAKRNPVPFEPKILPPTINTKFMEYLPTITADGSLLIFTRRDRYNEDFYVSVKKGDQWGPAEPIRTINTPDNEGAQAISADGRVLLFTACNRRGDYGSCDLYMATKKGDTWSTPRNIGPPVNTEAWESEPTLTADGQTVYFSSTRSGGLGGSDIWKSFRLENGNWSEPENLGEPVNTPFDEESPFLHPDLHTLYFRSNGHPGMGGYDLFLSRLDTAGQWQKPKNLGYPINTKASEGALFVTLDGKTAYFASDREEYRPQHLGGTIDIYTFTLPEQVRAIPSTYVETTIRDAETKEPLRANLEFVRLPEGQTHIEGKSGKDGYYLACLPAIGSFLLHVNHPGYIFYSEHFALNRPDSLGDPYQLDVYLQPLPSATDTLRVGEPIVLKNIFFETGSAKLRPESVHELNRLYHMLKESSDLHIQINGHTDYVGTEEDNKILSTNRAKAVYDYLVEKGIDPDRLTYRGFGEEKPIATNETPEGRQLNRRTEFEVIPPTNPEP